MPALDPAIVDVLRRGWVARLATLSRAGRPSVTPIYFVWAGGQVWLGTPDWTLAARDVQADPRVSLLFNVEHDAHDARLLRLIGTARVLTDDAALRAYNLRVAVKYILTPAGLRHRLAHWGLRPLVARYHAQSAAKGRAAVIDVTPGQAEFLR